MSPSTKTARIAVSLLTLLLLSGLVAFGSSPASSYGLDFGARDYAHDGLTWFEPDPLASKYHHLSPYAYCADNPLKFVDPEGTNPVYSRTGILLGTDDTGLQGKAIIMEQDNFHQGMSNDDAMSYNLGEDGLIDKDAYDILTIVGRPGKASDGIDYLIYGYGKAYIKIKK